MTEESVLLIFQIAREITVTGLLIAAIYGFVTGKIVTRFHYDEMKSKYQNQITELINGFNRQHDS